MKSCNNCILFYKEREENYTLFCCRLYNNHNAYYRHSLPDINWSNYKIMKSDYCPFSRYRNKVKEYK